MARENENPAEVEDIYKNEAMEMKTKINKKKDAFLEKRGGELKMGIEILLLL